MKKSISSGDGLLDRQFLGHSFKEWRMLDIGGGQVPGVKGGLRGGELVPVWVTSCYLAVHFLKADKSFQEEFESKRYDC